MLSSLPSLVKSLFLSLGTICTTDSRDLSPKSVLGLYYPNVVAMLLSLVPLLLGFELVLLSLHFGILSQGLEPVHLLQLLP